MSELRYVPDASHDGGVHRLSLEENECTIFRSDGDPRFRWHLRIRHRRKNDGRLTDTAVPVFPNEDAPKNKPGWGLKRVEAGRWQVSPSILVSTREPDPNDPSKHRDVELWHETPAIVGVPDGERWTGG